MVSCEITCMLLAYVHVSELCKGANEGKSEESCHISVKTDCTIEKTNQRKDQ